MINVGDDVGNYRVIKFLGEGGMGRIFVVEHRAIGKKAALKALQPELAQFPEVVSRFFTEARAVAKIGHPHIVDISDFGQTDQGEPYFIMELLEGESASARIAREGRLPPEDIVHISQQVASALSAAHAHQVLHRDLKSENLFLTHRDDDPVYVKVLDFGLAKLADETQDKGQTQAGIPMGTPWYMSPEQAQGQTSLDARTDVYSLGVIMFEMAVGRVPFDAETPMGILVQHVTRERPKPTNVVKDVPKGLERVILRAMARNRDERYPSMDALREDLLALREKMPAARRTPVPGSLRAPRASTPLAVASPQLGAAKPMPTPPGLTVPARGGPGGGPSGGTGTQPRLPSPAAVISGAKGGAVVVRSSPLPAAGKDGLALAGTQVALPALLGDDGDGTATQQRDLESQQLLAREDYDEVGPRPSRTGRLVVLAGLFVVVVVGGTWLERWATRPPAGAVPAVPDRSGAQNHLAAHQTTRPPVRPPEGAGDNPPERGDVVPRADLAQHPQPPPEAAGPQVYVRSTPAGADVYRIFNHRKIHVDQTPCPVPLEPGGSEILLIQMDGRDDQYRSVSMRNAGSTLEVHLSAPPPPRRRRR